MNQGVFQLDDNRFGADSDDIAEELIERFEETDFMGLVLDGPRTVLMDQHETVWLLGLRASTIRDNISISLECRAIMLVSHLDGVETFAATAFRQPDDTPPPSVPRDPATMPEGRTIKVFGLSWGDRLPDLDWKPGQWQSTLLLYDQRSNPVVTRLEKMANSAPAVQGFPASRRRSAFPAAVWPSPDLTVPHSYRQRADSPAAPPNHGIVLALDRRAMQGPGRTCLLRGSFRLPILPRDMVTHLPGPADSEAAHEALAEGWVDVGDADAIAVFPVTVLLTGDQKAKPLLFHLQVPVYGPVKTPPAGPEVVGFFAVDLFRLLPSEIPIQNYAVWAVSRGLLSEPLLLGLGA